MAGDKKKEMKIGSIVECVDNKNISTMKVPKLNHPYTVRGIAELNGVLLEEIQNRWSEYWNCEWGYKPERFRELLPPMEIQEALDECEPVLIEIRK